MDILVFGLIFLSIVFFVLFDCTAMWKINIISIDNRFSLKKDLGID